VNRIACNIVDGQVDLWGKRFAAENGTGGQRDGIAYLRPHDVELLKGNEGLAQQATVRHVNATGPVARVELAVDGLPGMIEAELSRQEFLDLDLRVGQGVKIQARVARVFPAELAPAAPATDIRE
jgi:sulfate transport system ATP-binding protein